MTESRREIDVQKVAALARLTLTAEEAEHFRPQLAHILEYIALLDRVDTTGIEPTSHVMPLGAPLREDTVRPGLSREDVMSQAPKSADGAFVVPKFVEGEK